MAKTSNPFETVLNNGSLLSDAVVEEEEYDAKNDETFGELEDLSDVDWEQQHEELSKIEENNKSNDEEKKKGEMTLEALYSLMAATEEFMNSDEFEELATSIQYVPNPNCKPPRYMIHSRRRPSNSHTDRDSSTKENDSSNSSRNTPLPGGLAPNSICTVQELEKNLWINQRPKLPPVSRPNATHNFFPPAPPHPQHHVPSRLPPGLPPPPMQMPRGPPMGPHNSMPMGMMRFMPPPQFVRPPPPGMMYPGNPQFPMNHRFNFMPPPRPMGVQNNGQMQGNHGNNYQQRVWQDSNNYRHRDGTPTMNNSGSQTNGFQQNRDDYAGLMTNREKQWLLNIQMLQLNTGTPYFDDYYYTIYKSRKTDNNFKRNTQERNHSNRNGRDGQHRNNERQDNLMQPRVYTPLQFENSLGKLQCGSVTAPRKIIDMDIVTPDKDSENATPRDTRKSRQILLELEGFYTLFLKAMDLKNPLAISDMAKLRELKQKQRLRELEAAQTQEQKQEVLKLLQLESLPVIEDQMEYLTKIVSGLLQDEKFGSYFNFSKGKMLVLRLLPYLTTDAFSTQLKDLWTKILISVPLVLKRDCMGDNILPKFYFPFKSYLRKLEMASILELVSCLTVLVKQENNRAPPRTRLHFFLSSKFGVSAIGAIILRVEELMSSSDEEMTDNQRTEWSTFLRNVSETLPSIKDVPVPTERIQTLTLEGHLNRFDSALSPTEKKLLVDRFTYPDMDFLRF